MEKINIFCDTCIIIEYLRDNTNILDIFNKIGYENLYINSIVIMELYQGALNKRELAKIKNKIKKFKVLEVNQKILSHATELLEKFNLTHNLKIPDSIVSSTCLIYNVKLWTYNKKDFNYIPNLELYTYGFEQS